jgi:hypothetical protein
MNLQKKKGDMASANLILRCSGYTEDRPEGFQDAMGIKAGGKNDAVHSEDKAV